MGYYKNRKIGVFIRIAILEAVIISGVALYFAMPAIVRLGVKKVDVIFPQRNEYTPSISCGGSVGFSQKCDIKKDIPLIIKEYHVTVGERVDQGQLIATVDKQAVLDAMSQMYPSSTGAFYSSVDIPLQINALISGEVCALAKSNEIIAAGESIAQIGGRGALVMNVSVPYRNIDKVRTGQNAVISISSADGSFEGKVISKSETPRRQFIGNVEETVADVVVSIKNPSEMLKSGMSGNVTIETGIKREAVTLPYSAIMQDDKSQYVYVIEDGRTVRRDIVTGFELADVTQVFGVSTEEEVVDSAQGIAVNALISRNRKG